eukprot:868882-Amphidinium_carterae.1
MAKLSRFCPAPKRSLKEHQEWWYDELTDARADIKGLSSGDLLKLDFKAVEVVGLRIGVSSIFADVAGFMHLAGGRARLSAQAQHFADSRGLQLLIMLTKASKATTGEKQKGFIVLVPAQSPELPDK